LERYQCRRYVTVIGSVWDYDQADAEAWVLLQGRCAYCERDLSAILAEWGDAFSEDSWLTCRCGRWAVKWNPEKPGRIVNGRAHTRDLAWLRKPEAVGT
jgi:hypothetical protein